MRIAAVVTVAAAFAVPAKAHRLPSWWVADAECVHSHEGAWNDPGAPYYGGLQMDIDFQREYGPWAYRHLGTADRWPRWLQLHVAYKGWLDRGWWPWPNTARACGLL